MKKVAIGVDIGGTNSAIGVVDEEGNVLVKGNIPTPSHGDVNKYVTDLAVAIRELIHSVSLMNPESEILGIGIGAPNGNYYNGTIEYAPNLQWKGVIPLAKLISDKFKKSCTLTNDANAAAVGEMMYGAARGMRDFIMITLG